jgi:hypothetical protein
VFALRPIAWLKCIEVPMPPQPSVPNTQANQSHCGWYHPHQFMPLWRFAGLNRIARIADLHAMAVQPLLQQSYILVRRHPFVLMRTPAGAHYAAIAARRAARVSIPRMRTTPSTLHSWFEDVTPRCAGPNPHKTKFKHPQIRVLNAPRRITRHKRKR